MRTSGSPTPAAATRTRTMPGGVSGGATSPSVRTSRGSPARWMRHACMEPGSITNPSGRRPEDPGISANPYEPGRSLDLGAGVRKHPGGRSSVGMRGCEELAHAAADRQPETGTAADRRPEAEPLRTRRAKPRSPTDGREHTLPRAKVRAECGTATIRQTRMRMHSPDEVRAQCGTARSRQTRRRTHASAKARAKCGAATIRRARTRMHSPDEVRAQCGTARSRQTRRRTHAPAKARAQCGTATIRQTRRRSHAPAKVRAECGAATIRQARRRTHTPADVRVQCGTAKIR
jgi:hypothetical protein